MRYAEKSLANLAAHSRERVARGQGPLKVGASLHVGEVAFGNIGTERRLDFTVIGQAVNLASRLAGQCGPLGRELIVSGAFARHAPRTAVPLGRHVLRGIPEPEELFTYELDLAPLAP
jgi:adenylate cyclase